MIDFSRVYKDGIQRSQATPEGARTTAMRTLAGFSSIQAIVRLAAATNTLEFHGNPPSVNVDMENSVEAAITGAKVCADSTNLAPVTITIHYNEIMWSPSSLTQRRGYAMRRLTCARRDDRGQIAVIVALLMSFVALGLGIMTIDAGNNNADRRQLRNGTDGRCSSSRKTARRRHPRREQRLRRLRRRDCQISGIRG
jgi:hypothetical protein